MIHAYTSIFCSLAKVPFVTGNRYFLSLKDLFMCVLYPHFKAKHILRQSNMIDTLVNISMRLQMNKPALKNDDLFEKYHYIYYM